MAHVEIRPRPEGAGYLCVVDGVDLGGVVGRGGVTITGEDDGSFVVSLTLVAASVDVDLPDAVIEATQREVAF